jgi:hypothetical protein
MMLAGQKTYWIGGTLPGEPKVFLRGGKIYESGQELPFGSLSDEIANDYEERGWITDKDPSLVEDVAEAPKPQPKPVQVEKEVSLDDENPIQVEQKMGLIPDVEDVADEISSGPKPKTKKKRKGGKRHG